jgi:hypothetical protein
VARWPVTVLAFVVGCADPPAPVDVDPWTELPLPDGRRRLEAAVTALGTQLVIAGGYASGLAEGLTITDEVIALDTLTGTWRELPELPVPVTHGALVGNGGILYAFGGHVDASGNATGRSFVLEAGAMMWQELEPMPSPRGAAAGWVTPPFVFLFGGADRDRVFGDVVVFDMIRRSWSDGGIPPLPVPRSHAAVTRQLDGTFVIAGGLDASFQPLGDVWWLRMSSEPGVPGRWAPAEPMPTRRGGCAFGTAFGALVCAGGEAGTVALDVVERYDPDGLVVEGRTVDLWTPLPAMPEPRAGAAGAMIGGKLYVVGGARSLAFEPVDSILVLSYVDLLRAADRPPQRPIANGWSKVDAIAWPSASSAGW